jgi:hypothetical protein
VAISGATTREMAAKVWATPMVVPSSDLTEAWDMSAVVAGKSSAVPIGTSAMTGARPQRLVT